MGKVACSAAIIALLAFLNSCVDSAVRSKAHGATSETPPSLIQENNKISDFPGTPLTPWKVFDLPGAPLRLPAKVIRIYIAPMKSPMGRLIGEHYVWAIVQEESWWTPGTTGLDTIAPEVGR